MPDVNGDFTPSEIVDALSPYMSGDLSTPSSATNAAITSWQAKEKPIIEQSAQLAGLGRSPALTEALANSYSTSVVPFYTADLSNRLKAADTASVYGLGRGREALGWDEANQLAAYRGAEIGDWADKNTINALNSAGNLASGTGSIWSNAATLGQNRLNSALTGYGYAGQAQRGLASELTDSEYEDYLRRQGLAENATTGLFGTVLPTSMGTSGSSTTKTSGGK